MSIARSLQKSGITIDLFCTADSVQTIDDLGDPDKVPANVASFHPYVIPTPAWMLAPFPIGRRDAREVGGSMDGVLNIGLTYNLRRLLRTECVLRAGGATGTGWWLRATEPPP